MRSFFYAEGIVNGYLLVEIILTPPVRERKPVHRRKFEFLTELDRRSGLSPHDRSHMRLS
jgi:hypothetical protein